MQFPKSWRRVNTNKERALYFNLSLRGQEGDKAKAFSYDVCFTQHKETRFELYITDELQIKNTIYGRNV